MILFAQTEAVRELEVRILSLQRLIQGFGWMFERANEEETRKLLRHIGTAGLDLDRLHKTSEYRDEFALLVKKIEQDLDDARNLCASLYIQSSMTELREEAIRVLPQGDMAHFDFLGDLIGKLFREGQHEEAIRILLETKEALRTKTPMERAEALGKIGLVSKTSPPIKTSMEL